jgi:hypothetical protein
MNTIEYGNLLNSMSNDAIPCLLEQQEIMLVGYIKTLTGIRERLSRSNEMSREVRDRQNAEYYKEIDIAQQLQRRHEEFDFKKCDMLPMGINQYILDFISTPIDNKSDERYRLETTAREKDREKCWGRFSYRSLDKVPRLPHTIEHAWAYVLEYTFQQTFTAKYLQSMLGKLPLLHVQDLRIILRYLSGAECKRFKSNSKDVLITHVKNELTDYIANVCSKKHMLKLYIAMMVVKKQNQRMLEFSKLNHRHTDHHFKEPTTPHRYVERTRLQCIGCEEFEKDGERYITNCGGDPNINMCHQCFT